MGSQQRIGNDTHFKKIARGFRWRCMDGRVLTLAEMQTSHIFNSMKSIFNHVAEAYGGTPVWFTKKYSTDSGYMSKVHSDPKALARVVAIFCWEIERRGDLPGQYAGPYRQILNQILGIKDLNRDALSLPEPPKESSPRMKEAVRRFLGPTFGDRLDNSMDGANGLDLFEDAAYSEDDD